MLEAIKTFYGLKRRPHQGDIHQFAWNSQVYAMSNENLRGYIADNPDMRGARVLSVCAAGDHAFESLLAGATRVDTFDINYMQKYVMELKMQMIRHVPYDHFMDFFFASKKFDRQIIRPIWSKLSLGARVFWRELCRDPSICMWAHYNNYDKSKCLSYVGDAGAYNRLRDIMPDKINFVQSDVLNLAGQIDGKYDVVFLSNIMNYILPQAAYITQLMDFYERVLTPLADHHLNDGALVYFNYIWGSNTNIRWREQFRDLMVDRDMIDSYNLSSHHEFLSQEFKSGIRNDLELKRDTVAMMRHRARPGR
ncbi:DUF3419 family protein [bacterium]|nr:DUF3419 family protein [bacterium]